MATRRPARRPQQEGAGRVRRREDPPFRARGVAARRPRRRRRGDPRDRRGRRDRGGAAVTELREAVGEVLIEERELQQRIAELGRELSQDYAGRDLLLVGVLKGAVFFMADLMRTI